MITPRLLLALLALPLCLLGQTTHHLRDDSPLYTEFLDKDFPFLEATVDFRGIAPVKSTDNLVPRALLVPLGSDVFVCFDTELLRVAGIWQGDFITNQGLAMLSYPVPLRKMGGGQKSLPQPVGRMIAATGSYPGWFKKGREVFRDPRPRWVGKTELVGGPLPPDYGEWLGAEDRGESVVLHYSLFGGSVREHFRLEQVGNQRVVVRSIRLEGVADAVSLVVGDAGEGSSATRHTLRTVAGAGSAKGVVVTYPLNGESRADLPVASFDFDSSGKKGKHWPNRIATEIELGAPQGSYAIDYLRLPYPNPWERRIRPYGIDFHVNGDAVVVTFDGDVYRLAGLGKNDRAVVWTKIAAGFHEPSSIKFRGDDIFVFSRMGITQLVDNDGDGETDFYRKFCNLLTQSGDTRDYPLSLVLKGDGSWIVSKGGQPSSAKSPHTGRVMHISADGKKMTYWASGLRNGYVSSIPERGDLIVTSDQQGSWVPTTPLHIVRQGSFLGHQLSAPADAPPIQPAALWLPHRVAQSGIDLIWGGDSRLGALSHSLLYLEYKQPSLLRIYLPAEGEIVQAAAAPLGLDIEVPLLKGRVNPTDGRPYMVGFQIFDSVAKRIEGLCRLRVVRETDAHPVRAELFQEGIMLRFSRELEQPKALNPASYQVATWDYKRTSAYGSAHYKSDGTPGVDSRPVHSVLLSKDGSAVFVAVDGLTKVMQLELQHSLFGKWEPVYFTANELPRMELEAHGFAPADFSRIFASAPAPRAAAVGNSIVSEARGQDVARVHGCVGCHSIDGTTEGRSGPTWKGLYNSSRVSANGSQVQADDAYLRQAILEPPVTARLASAEAGAGASMPPYKGVLAEAELDSLLLYIRSLK